MVATLGVVYTPPAVARLMVERALAPFATDTIDQTLALRICDPALGEGAFLLAVIDVLVDRLAALGLDRATARRRVGEHCIHGADIDARAVAVARAATAAGDHLRVGDALSLPWESFDVVVGNPPYIRQERIADKASLRGYAVFDGVADLYVYFVELAHRLARPGGRYCLVLPNKWLTVAYGRPLRAYLAAQASVEGLVDLGRAAPLFAGVDAFSCIVWGTIGSGSEAIACERLADGAPLALAPRVTQPRAAWQADPWHLDSLAERALIARLERDFPALDTVVGRPARGVVTGCNRVFVIDGATRQRLLDREPACASLIRPFVKGRDIRRWRAAPNDRWILLIDRGTSLDEFPHLAAYFAEHRSALEPRPLDHTGAWPGRKPGTYRWFELQDPVGALASSRAPRLFYQDIQSGPTCCLDESGLVPDTTVWILPTADRFLLALLNSPLYGWYAQRRFPPALNGAIRPKLEYISALPVAPSPPALAALVDRCLAAPTPKLEAAITAAVLDAYQLRPAERALVTGGR